MFFRTSNWFYKTNSLPLFLVKVCPNGISQPSRWYLLLSLILRFSTHEHNFFASASRYLLFQLKWKKAIPISFSEVKKLLSYLCSLLNRPVD